MGISAGEAIRRLRTISNQLPYLVSASAKTQTEYLKVQFMKYPPQNPGSTYVRTYTLKRGWEKSMPTVVGVSKLKVTVRVENKVKYWVYVQSRAKQRSFNKGKWTTVEDLIKKNFPYILKQVDTDLQKSIDLILNR